MKQVKKSKFDMAGRALRVGRSRTGLGLFAQEDIPKGECIIEYVGEEVPKEEHETRNSKYLFATTNETMIDGQGRSNTARYINHSCRPNCEVTIYKRRVYIFSRRNIKAGEELTYDYGKEYFDEYIKPHGCRCAKCRPAPAAAGAPRVPALLAKRG